MKKATLIIAAFLFVLSNPIIAQSKKELKKQKAAKEYLKTKNLIESGVYTFIAISANTQKGRRIDLSTNYNSLKFDNAHVIADLPFFGFSQVSSFNSDGGIIFDIENTDFEIEYNDKKHKITIKFVAKNKTESFDLLLTVYSNASAALSITSNQRDSMRYQGDVKDLSKEK